jgi:ribosomal protein S18 acetylase RimI-like enzyme
LEIRDALKTDARDLAYLVNLAGEGIPEHLWRGRSEPHETPLECGARRVAGDEGNFSYTKARVAVEGGAVLGMILSYRLPDPYEIGDLSDTPELVQPLVRLESQVPGSWYVNAIATYEKHRGKGVARRLHEDAEIRARSHGCRRLSLIVASENPVAKRLYESLGFKDVAALPVVSYPGFPHGGSWVLMIKGIGSAKPGR